MQGRRIVYFKIATILLAVSFFIQIISVIGIVFLKELAFKVGIFSMLVELHEYNGFLFVLLVVVHIYFNWGWIKNNVLKKKEV